MTLPYSTALVTGGAGFIGSHIVDRLLSLGMERVVSVDDYRTGNPDNLSCARNSPGNFWQHDLDINDSYIAAGCRSVGVVFHEAASHMLVSMSDPYEDLHVNLMGTINVIRGCLNRHAQKLIYASTGSVYGEQAAPLREDLPLHPVSFYGISKMAAEKYALMLGRRFGLDVTVLRYFNVYGPRQMGTPEGEGGVIPVFAKRAMRALPLVVHGDGLQTRSFTYVGDVVDANIMAMTDAAMSGEVYNVGSGAKVSILDLAGLVRAGLGSESPIEHGPTRSGDIRTFEVDNSKIKALGFQFKTPFGLGLANTLAWYRWHESGRQGEEPSL